MVRVHPGARHQGLLGWRKDGALKVAVSSPPEGGRANRAVAELLAARLGVRARQVRVVRGATSRTKRIEVEGLDEDETRRRLEDAMAGEPGATRGD